MRFGKFGNFVILWLFGGMIYVSIEIWYHNCSERVMFLVGATAFLIIGLINNLISWNYPLILQMLTGSFVITSMEYISGKLEILLYGHPSWDYSHVWGNYEGLICIPFCIIWFFLSLVAILISDCIDYYWLHSDERPYYRLFSWTGKPYYLPVRKCTI